MRRAPVLAVLFLLSLSACSGSSNDAGSTPASVPGVATSAAGSTPARSVPPAAAGAVSERYADLAFWHCHPAKADDVCDTADQQATVVGPTGRSPAPPHQPAVDPEIDCFYAYPTVSLDQDTGIRSFELPVNPLEVVVTQGAFAPFDEVCRLFAPRYEQVTPGGYRSAEAVAHSAVGDAQIEEAFDHSLATENQGRPFVVIGHSQGTHHLARFLKKRLDGDDEAWAGLRGQLVSALLLGPVGLMVTAAGSDVGGTFDRIPLCRANDQTGCAIAYDSFSDASPPAAGAPDAGLERACTNPANLAESEVPSLLSGGQFGRFSEGIDTAIEIWPDFYTATCERDGAGQPFLEISVADAPGDTREDDLFRRFTPNLHRIDPNLAMRDLLDVVARQSATYPNP